MKLSDFVIGEDFLTATGPWRCTDIGTRTISAVRWPDPQFAPLEYASKEVWLAGPPYILPEVVFDESEMSMAYRSVDESIRNAMADHDHPGFDGNDVKRMFDQSLSCLGNTAFEETYRVPLLRFDRVRNDEVLHPYAWSQEDPQPAGRSGCTILVLGVFGKEFEDVALEDWLRLPFSTPADLARIAGLYPHRRLWETSSDVSEPQ